MHSTATVVVKTTGGDIHIDVEASAGAGLFDGEIESGGEAIDAVKRNIAAGDAILDADGSTVVIERGAALAFTYRLTGCS